ncbi:MAG: ShlB/FhaC/HecB family hemolysin secretion/activation protein [Desulfobacterales bacterium]|nr:ShlB/FhaC/HecB family hemolysin secretion/activation protein [Desulfobacterales bacterium]
MILIIILIGSVDALGGPGFDPTGRSGDPRPDLLEEKPPGPAPRLLPPPPPPPRETKGKSPYLGVFVREIIISGSTAFSPGDFAEISAPYLNRELTNEDLEALRRAVTILYVNEGFINSGAVIPDQTVADGVLRLRVIEGELTGVEVEGSRWFKDSFIRDRLFLDVGAPLDIASIQRGVELLGRDPRVHRIDAELKPGAGLGQSVLKVNVEEKNPFKYWLGVNNYQSPTVGAPRGLITIAHDNPTGHGDRISLTHGRSEGLRHKIDFRWSFPFTARDATLVLGFRKNHFDVVEEPFEPLDVESESESWEITLTRPFFRNLTHTFAMGITLERSRNETFLLGRPFSFSPGAEDGESAVCASRFFLEWTRRTRRQVIAVRSRFSLGLDALGATIHDSDAPDGKFFSWLGQFQWAGILTPLDIQMLFRVDAQWSDEPLLPLEQIAVGGRYSVRGYRENQLVRDRAFIASLEARFPLIRDHRWADSLHLAPFVDYGHAENTDSPTPAPTSIGSVGVGLLWAATLIRSPVEMKSQLEIYWGYPLKKVDNPGGDLQDHGVCFQFAITNF